MQLPGTPPAAQVVPLARLLHVDSLMLTWQLAQTFIGSGAPFAYFCPPISHVGAIVASGGVVASVPASLPVPEPDPLLPEPDPLLPEPDPLLPEPDPLLDPDPLLEPDPLLDPEPLPDPRLDPEPLLEPDPEPLDEVASGVPEPASPSPAFEPEQPTATAVAKASATGTAK
jgi:hypothetical protein